MSYRSQAATCFLLAASVVWILLANFVILPGWLLVVSALAVTLSVAAGVRAWRRHRYYEGPRVALVVDPSESGSRRARRATGKLTPDGERRAGKRVHRAR